MVSTIDLLELAQHLKQERLFVAAERVELQNLNEKVVKLTENIYHVTWISRQQRIILDNLILGKPEHPPNLCCQHANALETVTFCDSYKQLKFHDSLYGDFLQQVRQNPKLLAMCLMCGEKLGLEISSQVSVILSSIYGNCILNEDEILVLKLLKDLMKFQLATNENPRRLLRHGSCAFGRMYKTFTEGLFSSKIFLTASLHEPILHLLMEDDMFLDIDPGKAAVRFPPSERLRKFGEEGSPEYAGNIKKYRDWSIKKLVNLTNRFIFGIKQNMYCFPESLSWLIKQVHNTVTKAGKVEPRTVAAICSDLLFTFFICPAIVNPEPYSITSDMPISYIARFNLMQIAQILQVLAMSKWEDIDPKFMDLYSKFEKDCMSSLLDLILERSNEGSLTKCSSNIQNLARSAVLITETELMDLIKFLRNVLDKSNDNELDKKLLEMCVNPLPVKTVSATGRNVTDDVGSKSSIFQHSPVTAKKNTLTRGKNRHKQSSLLHPQRDHNVNHNDAKHDDNSSSKPVDTPENVLVVTINTDYGEYPGMLTEEKVLIDHSKQTKVRMNIESVNSEENESIGGSETLEKRTRFSLSHDQDSIGNASDNLEAISEAASNHSVDSSIDMENENENDNFSDMVSANVSGRGTPNVSGRDTPSSQIEEDRDNRPLNLPVTAQKQNREDIADRFGKFEIKQQLGGGDETVSMVSDTWSTDVLASDSETVEQTDSSALNAPVNLLDQPPGGAPYLDISETASDAWSTDVVTSDTDRLQDIDTDDTGSVTTARSDDTARSEVDGDVFAVPLAVNQLESRSPGDGIPNSSLSRLVVPVQPKVVNQRTEDTIVTEDELTGDNTESRRKHQSAPLRSGDASNKVSSSPMQPSTMESYDCFGRDQRSSNVKAGDCCLLNNAQLSSKRIKEQATTEQPVSSKDDVTYNGERSTSSATFHISERSAFTSMSRSSARTTSGTNAECESNISTVKKSKIEFSKVTMSELSYDNVSKVDGVKKGSQYGEVVCSFDPLNEYDESIPQHSRRDVTDVRLSTTSSCSSTSVGGGSKSSGSVTGANLYPSDRDGVNGDSATKAKDVTVGSSHGGAIPKNNHHAQAEDASDEKNISENTGRDKDKKSFFKNLKFPFKGKTRKLRHSEREDGHFDQDDGHGEQDDVKCPINDQDARRGDHKANEIGDDILAKYRKKPEQNNNAKVNEDEIDSGNVARPDALFTRDSFHPRNPEASFVFDDAKRKLRMVLCTADIPSMPSLSRSLGWLLRQSGGRGAKNNCDNELVAFLHILLAEATNLEQRSRVAQLHEALRCVRLFDSSGCKKLFKSLKEDYKKRSPYIAYLIRSRQGLLSTIAHLQRVLDRIERDKEVCNKFMISICVQFFLSDREIMVQNFVNSFQKLTVPDEKTDLVEKFLEVLNDGVGRDPLWNGASVSQKDYAQLVIERSVMVKIYIHALYPNSDGDVHRDQVLHEHMKRLSEVITPNHKCLRIPSKYHYECPWPSAQAEIITINAYKTPKDKLQCVLRCCSTIMDLLSMASERSVPAADDFMPVLVYVLIKANPPSLMSTVQYVNSFYEKRLSGEESYWWTQFASAIEFIKTID